MPIATKSGGLILKDGNLATNCSCCETTFCCNSGSPPPYLELTISSFSSSRGDFTDFNPNQTYLLGFPEVEYNLATGTPSTLSQKCVCYNEMAISTDKPLWDAVSVADCTLQYNPFGPPYTTTLHELAVGSSPGSPSVQCRRGSASGSDDALYLYGYMNSRTTDYPSEVTVLRMFLPAESPSLGISRLDFIDAICSGSLSLSGSASVQFSQRTGLFACESTLGSCTFDWSLSVSALP